MRFWHLLVGKYCQWVVRTGCHVTWVSSRKFLDQDKALPNTDQRVLNTANCCPHRCLAAILLRGGITTKKRENLGQIPKKGGGGVEKNRRKFPISIWEFGKPRGGVSISQKCLNYNSGSDPILERRIEN